MDRKAIFFDIDGTLAFPNQPVSPAVVRAIRTARSRGHLVFLGTGRTEKSVPKWVADIGFDGGIFSAGGRSVVNGRELSVRTMPMELVKAAMEVFRRRTGAAFVLECADGGFPGNVEGFSRNTQAEAGSSTELQRILLMLTEHPERTVEQWQGESVFKIVFFTRTGGEMDALEGDLSGLGKVVRFDNLFPDALMRAGEMSAPGIDKGKALREICAACGVDVKDSIAFGDSMNDAEMLSAAGIGVAMGNAEPRVLALADRVCETCQEDGVARELQRMGLC